MPASQSTPPTTAWVVLGVLSHAKELSGYEIKKWADSSVGFFFVSPALSQVYSELRRLEALGYATSREAPQDDLRNKRLYRSTELGTQALGEWVNNAPVEAPVLKHHLALKVWLGHLADPGRLRELVAEHVSTIERTLQQVRASRERSSGRAEWTYPATALGWAERYYEGELLLAEQLLDDIEGGAAGDDHA